MQRQDLFRPRRLQRASLAALCAAMALALSGCEALMLATGQRTRLPDAPLKSVTAALPGNGALAPGGSAALSIIATTADGHQFATAGTGDGKVLADSYLFAASIAVVTTEGVVTLPDDPRLSEGRTPFVRVTVPGQPSLVTDLQIPVRYDVAYSAAYVGNDGEDGNSGDSGRDGRDGKAGSNSPGGGGGAGSNGSDGQGGGDGAPAPEVHVWITLQPGAHPLLRVRASESGRDHLFVVDPQGGSLAIVSRGGRGGDGGSGGSGGRGGRGGAGTPSGSSGADGLDGRPGAPGAPGSAGYIDVTFDPSAAPYADRFRFASQTGDESAVAPAHVVVARVPPLW
jgi:hypothetical protein